MHGGALQAPQIKYLRPLSKPIFVVKASYAGIYTEAGLGLLGKFDPGTKNGVTPIARTIMKQPSTQFPLTYFTLPTIL